MADTHSIQTIVAATDFSADAAAAVDWAAQVARERSARLFLVHAATIITPVAPEFISLNEASFGELRAQAGEELDGLAAPWRRRGSPWIGSSPMGPRPRRSSTSPRSAART